MSKSLKKRALINLAADEVAITWSPKKGFNLYLPMGGEDEDPVPDEQLIVTACGVRLKGDAEWRQSMLDWMHEQAEKVR